MAAYLQAQAIPLEDTRLFVDLLERWKQPGAHPHPTRAGQPALVLRRGFEGAAGTAADTASACTCICSRRPIRRNMPGAAPAPRRRRYLEDLGLLGPQMTLGHGVWLTEADIERVAETGTMICHNASSNLRLRSGMAPFNHWAARGVRVAIGLDEAGINDDRDMLQEMRLVLRLHRVPGMEDAVPTSPRSCGWRPNMAR